MVRSLAIQLGITLSETFIEMIEMWKFEFGGNFKMDLQNLSFHFEIFTDSKINKENKIFYSDFFCH